jgi:uncharacterized protein (TIGR02300 family)
LLLTARGDHGNWRLLHNLQLAERGVARAEWGLKRTCLSCGARFYDLQREPIVCPACGAAFDATGQPKSRRPRAAPAPVRVAVAAVAVVEVEVVEDDADPEVEAEEEEIAAEEAAEDEGEEDGESAIEDVSELGDDDMADVIDTEIEEEETDR